MTQRQADSDGDGTVTLSQFVSALSRNDKSSARLTKLFADSDGDGDGKMSLADLERTLGQHFGQALTYGSSGEFAPMQGARLSATA